MNFQGSSCHCTAKWTACMDTIQTIDPLERDKVNGISIVEMCLADGCSAAECGLKEVGCNATSLACGDLYMACKVCMYVCMYACMNTYVCICACVHVCIYRVFTIAARAIVWIARSERCIRQEHVHHFSRASDMCFLRHYLRCRARLWAKRGSIASTRDSRLHRRSSSQTYLGMA